MIKETKTAVLLCIKAGITPMIWGPHGVGKSSLVKQLCAALKHGAEMPWKLIDKRLSQSEAPDLKGMPDRDLEKMLTIFLPPDDLPHGEFACHSCLATFGDHGTFKHNDDIMQCPMCEKTHMEWKGKEIKCVWLHHGILFLDETNRAYDDVLQAVFQLILDRKIGKYTLPTGWHIVCAGNYMGVENEYVLNNFKDAAFLDRFCHLNIIINNEYIADFSEYMYSRGYKSTDKIVAFISFDKRNLSADISPDLGFPIRPSSRSWEFFAKVLDISDDFSDNIVEKVLSGIVGTDIANHYLRYNVEITPSDIICDGVQKHVETLEKISRDHLCGLTWGLIGNVKERVAEDPVRENTLDFVQWLASSNTQRDLAVMMCHRLIYGETTTGILNAAVIANKKIQDMAIKFSSKKSTNTWLNSLNSRKELAELVAQIAKGV